MSSPSSEPIKSQTSAEDLAQQFGDRGNYVVRAGAGAGKTTELVSRVLGLAVRFKTEKGRWPHLVVTTFTRKATQELRERLLQKALQTKNLELIDYVQRPSLLHVSTIHGVLAMFLSQAGSHLGMNPRFQWMDNSAEVRVLKKILRQILQEEGPDLACLLDEVNLKGLIPALQQAYHLRAEKGKALVSASLAELQVVPKKLVREWTEQALDFLACAEGIPSLTKSKNWPDYQTLLRLTCQRLQENPEAFQEHLFYFDENKTIIKLTGEAEPLAEKRTWLQKTATELAQNWAHSKEAMLRHEEMAKAFERLSEKIFQELWRYKIQQSSLTMSDLETISLGLCHSHPEAAADFSKLWDYWMVDEYQDTSPRQVELLSYLQGDRESFTVGDPQQSIYLFRGARAEVFQQKEELAKKQGGQLLRKMTNYRSQPELLKFLNHFFADLGGQFSKMELDPGKPLRGTAPAVAEYFECGEEVSLNTMIIRRCREWIEAGVPAEQICVLARTNKTLQELAEEAGNQGIAVQVHAASRFYERREVQDALSLLKFLCNPHDNRNLMILLRSPWFRIPDSVLVKALANLVGESHWLTLLKNCADPVLLKLQDLRKQADAMGLRMAWEQGLHQSGLLDLASMVDPTGRREANLWKLICLLREEERRPGFRFLDFAEKAEPTTADIEDGGDADATPVELPQRVNLMTVHAAKGLQFRHVILASMGSFRSRRKSSFFLYHEGQEKFSLGLRDPETDSLKMMGWAEEWQEELKKREQQEYDRVLYVALTRAQDSVALFWEKPEKGSWAQRMWRPALGDTETEGFRTRYQVIEKEEDLPVKKLASAPAPVLLKPWVSPARVRVGQLSVSDILEAKGQKSNTAMGSPNERIEQALRGVSVHRWLESLRYQALPTRPEDRKWIQYVESWQEGRLLKWIKTGEVEWGFCVALQLQDRQEWIQGQIDLWTRDQDQIWVIDYKTGSEKQKRKAFEQLDIYAWALQQTPHARGLECHLAVVYPHTENVYTEKATPVAEMTKKLQELLQSRSEIK